jgi:threonine dehydrogenase-like Zn-dependent dehydrogenase
MRAAVMRNKKIVVDDIAVPTPGPGEVLVKTLACGICGSDLHALKHADKLVEVARRTGGPFIMDINRDVVMGHEFCAELVDFGPNTQRSLKPGTRVCAMPVLVRSTGVETVGYSNDNPGGYGEYTIQLRQGSTRIFACCSGEASSSKAPATPATPTLPVMTTIVARAASLIAQAGCEKKPSAACFPSL